MRFTITLLTAGIYQTGNTDYADSEPWHVIQQPSSTVEHLTELNHRLPDLLLPVLL